MTADERNFFYKEVGEKIKWARKKAGLKQEAFADLVKISRVSIVNIEKGRQTPPIHVLWKMAKALNIPVGELFPDDVLSNGNSWDKIFSEQIPDYVSKENLLKFLGKTNS